MKIPVALLGFIFLTMSLSAQRTSEIYNNFFHNFSHRKILHSSDFKKNQIIPGNNKQPNVQLKSANELKLTMDSVVFVGVDKEEYIYDIQGNLLTDIYYEWNGSWEYSWKEKYSYYENGYIKEYIDYYWDGNEWVPSWKYEYEYDSIGNNYKNYSSQWVDGGWNVWQKTESVFDESGNRKEISSSNWNVDLWEYDLKEVAMYDSTGVQVQNTSYTWLEDWIEVWQDEFAYDSLGNLAETKSLVWDTDKWINDYRIEYKYNENGEVNSFDGYIWIVNQWYYFFNYQTMFDELGNRIQESYFESDGEKFEKVWKSDYTYDNAFSYENLVLPFTNTEGLDIPLLFNHKLELITNFEGDGEDWIVESSYNIYYSERSITGIPSNNVLNQVKLFPNPAKDKVTFINAPAGLFTVEFFDMYGRMVKKITTENQKSVSIESLQKGKYLYRVTNSGNYFSGKLIVQ